MERERERERDMTIDETTTTTYTRTPRLSIFLTAVLVHSLPWSMWTLDSPHHYSYHSYPQILNHKIFCVCIYIHVLYSMYEDLKWENLLNGWKIENCIYIVGWNFGVFFRLSLSFSRISSHSILININNDRIEGGYGICVCGQWEGTSSNLSLSLSVYYLFHPQTRNLYNND